jgi:serine/threonine protein kinase
MCACLMIGVTCYSDVKPDTILLLPPRSIRQSLDIKLMDEHAILCTRLAITDLGEAFDANDLGGRGHDMKMAYPRDDISKGGHLSYLAPEVLTARPGPNVLIDYATNDAWYHSSPHLLCLVGSLIGDLDVADRSLGCVLFNMMSISPSHPFDVVRDPYRAGSLPLLSTEYSSELRHIVRHLLITDPKQRLPLSDAVHMLADLLHCSCGSSQPQTIARPLATPYPPKQCLRCGTEFGIFHRRYHCSSCQHAYCAECSTRKAPSGSRLCEWCYRRLY